MNGEAKVRIVIAENNQELKNVWKNIFQNYSELQILEGDNATETLELVEKHRPNILIVNAYLPCGSINLEEHCRDIVSEECNLYGLALLKYLLKKGQMPEWTAMLTTWEGHVSIFKALQKKYNFTGNVFEMPFSDLRLETAILDSFPNIKRPAYYALLTMK